MPFSGEAYATDLEVELLSHLMVYRVYDNTVLMDQLFALCELIIFDSPEDYEFLSPSQKGIWKIPPSWSNQTIINKVKGFILESASAKPGWLFPIEMWLQTDRNVSTSADGIARWGRRLALGKDKTGALLIPSSDRNTRARLPHMLPAMAFYIRKNYLAMDERLQRFGTSRASRRSQLALLQRLP